MKHFRNCKTSALLVLVAVGSGCSLLFSAAPGLRDVSEYRGCYGKANDELRVVLNLNSPEASGDNTSSTELHGCLTFAKNDQPFVGPFLLIGDSTKKDTAKMKATVPTGDTIKVTLKRDIKTINLVELEFISIDFPGELTMEDISKETEYLENTLCPIQCL